MTSNNHRSSVSFFLNYYFIHPDHKKSFLGIIPNPSTCPHPFLIIKVSPGDPKSHHARSDRSIPPPMRRQDKFQSAAHCRFTDEDYENTIWSYDFLELVDSFDRPSATEDDDVHVRMWNTRCSANLGLLSLLDCERVAGEFGRKSGISCSIQRMGPCI